MERRQTVPTLLQDLPRGVPDRRLDSAKGYTAAWRDSADLRNPAFGLCRLGYDPHQGRGLLLGSLEGQSVGVEDDRHIMTVAGSRSGKGVSVIIPNLLFYRGSALVMDPKGENADITAARRAKDLGHTVHILDPFQTVADRLADYRASYNPLCALDPDKDDSLVADVGLIGDALVMRSEREAHWDDTAQNWIEGVILHVVTWPTYKDCCDLVTVRHLLMHGTSHTADGETSTGMAGLFRQMEDNEAARGAIQAAAVEMQDRSPTEQNGVLSTARRHTKFLDLAQLQDVVQNHDFDLADLKRQPMTLYICVPASRLGLCARWMRLFVNQTLAAMEQEPTPRGMLPVRLILDEMPVLGHMRQLEDAAGQMAGFGVQIHGIIQDLGQLQHLYAGRWESFLGNSGVLQFFGNSDLSTLRWIAERLGKTTIEVVQTAEIPALQAQQGLTGRNRGREVVDLLAADEAARYFARADTLRRCLVIQPDTRPLILQRYHYREDTLFKGLWSER